MKFIKIFGIIISICLSAIYSLSDGSELFCGNSLCHPTGGKCINSSECICNPGYITINYKDDHINCNYKQTSRTKAFIIELIFGFGLGHFYSGRTGVGLLKFFCYSLFCSCCCTSLYLFRKIREESEAEDHPYVSLLFILSVIFKVSLVIWQIVDSFLFLIGYYKDGKGFRIY